MITDWLDPVSYKLGQAAGGGGGVTVEPLSVTENGVYTAPSNKAYSPVTVAVDPNVRPADWPNVDVLALENDTVYLTYDLRKGFNDPWLGIAHNWSPGTAVRGHIENGAFVADESINIRTEPFQHQLSVDDGEVQLWKISIPTATRFAFADSSNGIDKRLQPCVEMRGNLASVTMLDASLTTFYTERVRLVLSSALTTWNGWFINSLSLKSLDLTGSNLSRLTGVNNNAFKGTKLASIDLRDVTFGTSPYPFKALDGVIAKMINFGSSVLIAINANSPIQVEELYVSEIQAGGSTDLVTFQNMSMLSPASLNRIIAALDEIQETHTITLGASNQAKLTADEIAVATAKGWTVA